MIGYIDGVVATVKNCQLLAKRLGLSGCEMNLFEGVFDNRVIDFRNVL